MNDEDQMEKLTDAHLFVYGTLRKGFRSHALLSGLHARFLTTGHVQGRLYDLGEYPGAVESERDADRIRGEVYLLPRAELAFRVLDRFEGFDPARPAFNLFERKTTKVTLAGSREMKTWIYWLSGAGRCGRRVPSGDYAL